MVDLLVSPQGGENSSSSSHSSTFRSRRGCARKEPVLEVLAEGTVFLGALVWSDPQDGPSTHFPNPKVMGILKRSSLEEKYLLPARYKFVSSDADAAINKSPPST